MIRTLVAKPIASSTSIFLRFLRSKNTFRLLAVCNQEVNIKVQIITFFKVFNRTLIISNQLPLHQVHLVTKSFYIWEALGAMFNKYVPETYTKTVFSINSSYS